jgi:phage gp46-like protein
MALDLKFDPVTHDLIDGPGGTFEETDRADTAVYLQLTSHFREWWGDVDAGSLLHDLRRFQSDPAVLMRDEAMRALGLLETVGGLIADVDVIVEEGQHGRLNVATRFRDIATSTLMESLVDPGEV